MRIRKLELNGFKSFPDRAVVEFGPGISCVVGPNGCGKSNILDAIKWVIGEQSAKALRGGEMLDVIFAGSQARAAVGYAEVAMTLTAEDGEPFPGDYARLTELQVGRRLHRTGASEYFINQTRCRRKDITELFLDTGVSSDLYCFIEQGSVGKIVQATALERRALIEEAAGISRYKTRREEARERLVATGTQLDRAADVAEEMERRLRLLESQVVKAARYRRLRARLQQQEIVLALARYADLAAERRALREAVRDARRRAEAGERELARRQHELAARAEEIAVVEAGAATWRDEVAEQDARIRELEATLGFTARRREELTQQTESVAQEVSALEQSALDADRQEASLGDEIRALDAAIEVASGRELAASAALAAALERLETARERLARAEEEVAGSAIGVEAARARVADLDARLRELPALLARREAEVAAAEAEWSALRGGGVGGGRAAGPRALARRGRGGRGRRVEGASRVGGGRVGRGAVARGACGRAGRGGARDR